LIELESHTEGIVLLVRAQPGAKQSEVRGEQNGALKVAVTQVAEKGKANKALLALVGKQLGLRKSQIDLLSGETSQQKRLLIRDVSLDELKRRVAALVK
jgi:hypothetical protein